MTRQPAYRQTITAETIRVGDQLRGYRGTGLITPEAVTAVTLKARTVVIETTVRRYTRPRDEQIAISAR